MYSASASRAERYGVQTDKSEFLKELYRREHRDAQQPENAFANVEPSLDGRSPTHLKFGASGASATRGKKIKRRVVAKPGSFSPIAVKAGSQSSRRRRRRDPGAGRGDGSMKASGSSLLSRAAFGTMSRPGSAEKPRTLPLEVAVDEPFDLASWDGSSSMRMSTTSPSLGSLSPSSQALTSTWYPEYDWGAGETTNREFANKLVTSHLYKLKAPEHLLKRRFYYHSGGLGSTYERTRK